ncbi:MAG: 2-phosphosulfolactate phosphatase, partial [Bacteroidia bacterium]|nr:2-phosphosulfolactate phosphatase [Bacteroidia bacterium]
WKNKFNMEDTMYAGALTQRLITSGKFISECDSASASQYIFTLSEKNMFSFLENSSHRRRLEKLKLEEDIRYCLTPNLAPVIPILEDNYLKKI